MEPSSQPTLEYRFRESARYASLEIPAWATRFQRGTFDEIGLILWNHKTKTVTHLSGTYLLGLYEEMKTEDCWRQTGVMVGKPATRLSIDHPDEPPRPSLVDPIQLNPQQAQEIFLLMESKLEVIQQLAAAEEKAMRKVLGEVYRLILSWRDKPSSAEDTENKG